MVNNLIDWLLDYPMAAASLIIFSLLAGAAGGFLLGRDYLGEQAGAHRQLIREHKKLSRSFSEQERQQLALQLGADVDRHALEEMRSTVVDLDRQLSDYSEELSLYRNLVKSDDTDKGLQISNFLIRSTEAPSVYRYRFVLRKTEALAKATEVGFAIKVVGVLAGQSAELALTQLDPKVSAEPVKSKFKYFQIVEGMMHLPQDFTPEAIHVEAWPLTGAERRSQLVVAWLTARGQTNVEVGDNAQE